MEDELIEPRIPLRDESPALDRRHHLSRRADLPRHLDRRGFRHGLDIAVETHLDIDVPFDRIVHQRRAGLACLQHVDDGGQLLIFDADLGRDVLGLRPAIGDTERDQLADLADLVRDQRSLLRSLKAGEWRHRPDRPHIAQVLRREYAIPQMIGNTNAGEARMRHGAAHERHIAHARKTDVADVLAAAVQEAVILLAAQPRADGLLGQSRFPGTCSRRRWS